MREKTCAALAEGPVATSWHSADHALLETTLSRRFFSRMAKIATLAAGSERHITWAVEESLPCCSKGVQGSGFPVAVLTDGAQGCPALMLLKVRAANGESCCSGSLYAFSNRLPPLPLLPCRQAQVNCSAVE